MAGSSKNDDDGLIAGINVTPLVDVTLVLLIIFMVTAKIIVSQGMPMDLPKAASGEALQTVFAVELTFAGEQGWRFPLRWFMTDAHGDRLPGPGYNQVPAIFLFSNVITYASRKNVTGYSGWPVLLPRLWGVSIK